MTNVIPLIDCEMASRKIKDFKVIPIQIYVNEPSTIIDLNKYIYLFASTEVDTPALPTRITIQSPDNIYQFTKTTLENTRIAQHQFFSEEMQILVENFGSNDPSEFIPFMLEFYKIIPILDNEKEKEKKS